MKLLKETLDQITSSNQEIRKETKEKWDSLLKPIGSLGKLEEISIKYSAITGSVSNKIEKKAIVVMAADNGVVEAGVSNCPQDFTLVLANAMIKGTTGLATLGKFVGADIYTVDLGMIGDGDEGIINKKISSGTNNFLKGPAMTRDQCIRAIEVGIEIGDSLYNSAYDILGTGELGIGNTTTSAAVFTSLTGIDVGITCGKGAGITEAQYENKKDTIIRGIEINKIDRTDPIDVVAKVGGYDIAGICGLYLSAAKNKKPIVMDGFISSTAGLVAMKLKEEVKDYMFPSHLSKEPGAKVLAETLGLEPMLNMDMRLGEGSGCPLAFQLIETALFTLDNMGTYQGESISSEGLVDLREEK